MESIKLTEGMGREREGGREGERERREEREREREVCHGIEGHRDWYERVEEDERKRRRRRKSVAAPRGGRTRGL